MLARSSQRLTKYGTHQKLRAGLTKLILGVKELKASGLFGTFPSDADEEEHGIEMHLPFLYKATEESENGVPNIVPIVVGSCSKSDEKKLGKILAEYFKNEENTFIVSTDFCHCIGTRMVQNGFADTAQRSTWGKLQWIGYAQSSKAKTISDSSVSYASGYAIA
ncbi:hypothetical protein D0Z00_000723 [Geotrichum galactomycetum]|uniref:Uncharacterized protein n=1 Tax=Geotrichum galactomycetum TaxID=27317 RepID=A0ACB6V8S8_9ASCO|nr:hypothetical protein D0Z00_000723 [Geotrichum candidum]